MRDIRARIVVVGLVLGFPFLVAATSRREARVTPAAVVAVEAVLLVGLTVAARERGRLIGERRTVTRGTYVGRRTPLAHLRPANGVVAGR